MLLWQLKTRSPGKYLDSQPQTQIGRLSYFIKLSFLISLFHSVGTVLKNMNLNHALWIDFEEFLLVTSQNWFLECRVK